MVCGAGGAMLTRQMGTVVPRAFGTAFHVCIDVVVGNRLHACWNLADTRTLSGTFGVILYALSEFVLRVAGVARGLSGLVVEHSAVARRAGSLTRPI